MYIYTCICSLKKALPLQLLCLSDGTLNGAPFEEEQPSWQAKDRFTGFR